MKELSSTSLEVLTDRELEVAVFVAAGWLNDDIATELGVSSNTIRVLTKRAADKLPGEGRPTIKIARFSHIIAQDRAT